jgi:hypothetical protein
LIDFQGEIQSYRNFLAQQTQAYQHVVEVVQGAHDKRAQNSAAKLEMQQTKMIERAEKKKQTEAANRMTPVFVSHALDLV